MSYGTIIALVVVVVVILSSVKIVHTKEALIVERLGQYSRTLEQGVHFLLPFLDTVRRSVNLSQQIREIPPQGAVTHENVPISIDSVVFYEVLDPRAAVYNIQNYVGAIEVSVATSLRNVIGTMTLDEMFNSRERINAKLSEVLDSITNGFGIKVLRVEIRDIRVSADIQDSMDKQMKAERSKRATILEAEAQREKDVKTAEGEKLAAILRAEAEKEANIRRAEGLKESQLLEAEGKANAILKVADAEAEAIRKINSAIKESGTDQVVIALKQVEALIEMSKNPANKIFLPTDSIKSLGSIGAVAEMLKDNNVK